MNNYIKITNYINRFNKNKVNKLNNKMYYKL